MEDTKGAIKLDLYNTRGTLRVAGEGESYFLIHESKKKMMTERIFIQVEEWTEQ